MLSIKTFVVNPLKTNCYFIKNDETNKIAIIDPGGISLKLNEEISQYSQKNFEYILLTHGHFDHIKSAQKYREITGAKIVIALAERDFTKNAELNLSNQLKSRAISPFEADVFVQNDDILEFGNTKIKVIHTPGHTMGSVCYIVDDCIFTGDTLMKCTIGRTDLQTGNANDIQNSLKKLCTLTKNYKIYPGHGEISTLDYEKSNNIYLKF